MVIKSRASIEWAEDPSRNKREMSELVFNVYVQERRVNLDDVRQIEPSFG